MSRFSDPDALAYCKRKAGAHCHMRSVIPAGLNGFSSAGLLPFAALHHLINFLFDG
jgi:hypothetical protein